VSISALQRVRDWKCRRHFSKASRRGCSIPCSGSITAFGYGLIVLAGAVMLVQSLRAGSGAQGSTLALTAGVGLLPCPLTMSVLGFAWLQSSGVMVAIVLLSLALGISLTIGSVALFAMLAR
jgi:ABC-type nickel/cobalt efflux system permease component RcnA